MILNGYVYFVCPVETDNHINLKHCKIGFTKSLHLEEFIHTNYSRSFAKMYIYDFIPSVDPVKNEKNIHNALSKYTLNTKHEVFDISSEHAQQIVSAAKNLIQVMENTFNIFSTPKNYNFWKVMKEIIKYKPMKKPNKIVKVLPVIEIVKEVNLDFKNIFTPPLNDNIIKTFNSIKDKLISNKITENDFKELLGKKLLYTPDLFVLFNKFLMSFTCPVDQINLIYSIKECLDDHIEYFDQSGVFIKANQLKELLKNHNIKISNSKQLELCLIKIFPKIKFMKDYEYKKIRYTYVFLNIQIKNSI
jgi:hypothetical protein